MSNITKKVVEKFFDIEEIDVSNLIDEQRCIVNNLNASYDFQCPECGSENILLGYSDNCIIWRNQKTNELYSLGIIGFKKRCHVLKELVKRFNLKFPLTITFS